MARKAKKRGEGAVLSKKIKGIKVAMLTTVDEDSGTLHSRPMLTLETEFDGNLWFFTQASAAKVHEAVNQQVNISYVTSRRKRYVSVSGVAQLTRDHKKMDELWKPDHSIWFAGGKDDPDLALLKVTVTSAEYWDGPSNTMIQIFPAAQSQPIMEMVRKLQVV